MAVQAGTVEPSTQTPNRLNCTPQFSDCDRPIDLARTVDLTGFPECFLTVAEFKQKELLVLVYWHAVG